MAEAVEGAAGHVLLVGGAARCPAQGRLAPPSAGFLEPFPAVRPSRERPGLLIGSCHLCSPVTTHLSALQRASWPRRWRRSPPELDVRKEARRQASPPATVKAPAGWVPGSLFRAGVGAGGLGGTAGGVAGGCGEGAEGGEAGTVVRRHPGAVPAAGHLPRRETAG